MNSNPALGFLGFWMVMQLVATLALLIGGIYLMFCLGRAASGLDRMANAMEDWVSMEQAKAAPRLPQTNLPPMSGALQPSTPASNIAVGSTPAAPDAPLNTAGAPIPNSSSPAPVPFTPAATPQTQSQSRSESQPQTEYSRPDESPRF